MEAGVGIEPTNAAFAEPCLTTWLPRHPLSAYPLLARVQVPFFPLVSAPRPYPRRRRSFHKSFGLTMPAGVMMPVINSGGVTSKPGFRAGLVGLAMRT